VTYANKMQNKRGCPFGGRCTTVGLAVKKAANILLFAAFLI